MSFCITDLTVSGAFFLVLSMSYLRNNSGIASFHIKISSQETLFLYNQFIVQHLKFCHGFLNALSLQQTQFTSWKSTMSSRFLVTPRCCCWSTMAVCLVWKTDRLRNLYFKSSYNNINIFSPENTVCLCSVILWLTLIHENFLSSTPLFVIPATLLVSFWVIMLAVPVILKKKGGKLNMVSCQQQFCLCYKWSILFINKGGFLLLLVVAGYW